MNAGIRRGSMKFPRKLVALVRLRTIPGPGMDHFRGPGGSESVRLVRTWKVSIDAALAFSWGSFEAEDTRRDASVGP